MDALVEAPKVQVDIGELVRLCAVDLELFAKTFFPNTVRQVSPPFGKEMDDVLVDPNIRLANISAFRGSAKTTKLRIFLAHRVAYGITRTALYVGAAEKDAIRSVRWLRRQIERNKLYAQTYGLEPGAKWQETEIEIHHKTLSTEDKPHNIWVLGAGMTGSIRGINFDDYRPDLIIVDDPIGDEDVLTDLQMDKLTNLIHGAIKNSLAPKSEEPNAKLAILATPLHRRDPGVRARSDPEFHTLIIPCWTAQTMGLPTDQQISAWPERYPSEELRQEKTYATMRGKLSVFAREKECRLTTEENSSFRAPWIIVRSEPLTRPPFCVLAIDPVPPPSAQQLAKMLLGKDFEAHAVWGAEGGKYHLMDYRLNRGHEPNWTIATFFELAYRFRIARALVEAVAYQRTLKWILEEEMKRKGVYYTIIPYVDPRSKYNRITSTLSNAASNGLLTVGPNHGEFVTQFESYPNVDHDDLLDASAIALSSLISPYMEGQEPGALPDMDDGFPLIAGCAP